MELDREKALEILLKLTLSKPNDAIALAMDPENVDAHGLDLMCLGEFRRNSAGSVELKFIDRLKAVSLLLESLGGGEDGMRTLLDALGDDAP